MRRSAGIVLSAAVAVMATTTIHAAQLTPNVVLDTSVRIQGVEENNVNLGTGSRHSETLSTEATFRMNARLSPSALFVWEARAAGGVGRASAQNADTGAFSADRNFLEWRESYLELNDVAGQPLYLRVGRQRLRDDYGLWWNQNFDAVKVGYKSTIFDGFVAAGQNLASYNTSTGSLKKNDRDLARIMAEGSWQYYFEHFLEARMMYQDDHSGTAAIGTVEDSANTNNRDGNLFWGGLRAVGKAHCCGDVTRKVSYRFDLMGVAGNEDVNTSVANTVTATNNRSVRGWAFDGGVDVPVMADESTPLIHLGYAYGSGDSNTADGRDHAFRQTGLDGNFSKVGALARNTNNYGTVLRPELSNIHVYSAGVTKPVFKASDAGLIARYYRLANDTTTLSTGVSGALDGVHRDLGKGVDLVFNSDLMKTWDLQYPSVQDVNFRGSAGLFRTGDAYGVQSGENVLRIVAEVQIKF